MEPTGRANARPVGSIWTARRRTARTLKSFSHHDNLFAETGRKTSRSSANDDEINPVNRPGVVVFSTGG
jgi:hypothetical protein